MRHKGISMEVDVGRGSTGVVFLLDSGPSHPLSSD